MESDARQQVRVNILNQQLTLLVSGDPRPMEELAVEVDDLMNSIARRSPNLDSLRVALYACLQLAGQLKASQTTVDQKLEELSTLLDEALSEQRRSSIG